MFGLPVWAIELIIEVLKLSGFLGWAGALSAKIIIKVDDKLQNLKTYHDSNDFPQPYPGKTNINNLS